jgi:hypothetical protein
MQDRQQLQRTAVSLIRQSAAHRPALPAFLCQGEIIEALLHAKGVDFSAAPRAGKAGRKPGYSTKVQFNGNLNEPGREACGCGSAVIGR